MLPPLHSPQFIATQQYVSMEFIYYLTQGIFGLLLGLILVYKFNMRTSNTVVLAPEPPGAWPLLGHLPLLGLKNKPLHRVLGSMAEQYGPVFTIWLGVLRPTLVVSSKEAVKECLTINDKAFASRPLSDYGKYLGYNNAGFGSAPYGTRWREGRKITTLHLLTRNRVKSLNHLLVSEVDNFVHDLWKNSLSVGGITDPLPNNVIVLSEKFKNLSLNMIVRLIVGNRYDDEIGEIDEAEKFKHSIEEALKLGAGFSLSDVFPNYKLLEKLDLGGRIASMKRIAKELDLIMDTWINDHVQNRLGKGSGSAEDFTDVLLATVEEDLDPSYTRLAIVKATILTILTAGYDTTAVTLIWLVSLLLNNPSVLKRAQEELDLIVGGDRVVSLSDIGKLTYLHAVVKETIRLYPAAPLSVPHESIQDCNVAGYHVPKGTMLMVNLWKLHRDPCIWTDPEQFNPDRFITHHLDGDIDVFEQNYEFLPFGAGRRSCPGKALGLQNVYLIVARLLQAFEIRTPSEDVAVDMNESVSFVLPKATPLEVVLIPRLPQKLYII